MVNGLFMSFRVLLNPSQKVFTAERVETLLEAALRSGIPLKYSCNTGVCGECVGRVVAGNVRNTRPHDFKFTADQQAQGCVLLCSCVADSDLEIRAQEVGGVEEIPLQKILAKVERLERIDEDTLILHLRTPRSQTLRFLAGQYINLSIEGLQTRSKSLGSCPCNAMNLQFHIRLVRGDLFSEYVFSQLRPSQSVMVEGPFGEFSLDEASRRPIIFVAYETGFAPIKSIIEHTFALEFEQPIHLYWMVRQVDKHYLQNLCRSWVDAMDNFKYTPLLGVSVVCKNDLVDSSCCELDVQNVDQLAAAIVSDYPDLSGFDIYLTTPDSSLGRITQILQLHGLPQVQMHRDTMQRF